MSDVTADYPFVFVNAIEIPSNQVEAFIAGWRDRADFMRHQPGFRDYRLLRAILPDSRFQLVNVARWDSQEAFGIATADPDFQAALHALNDNPDFDVTPSPGLYRVALEAQAANVDPAPAGAADAQMP
ncbi:antibiotic biosynthesis monooxygenase family protein [Mycolicibacterium sp.]|uniref:antibiotic biosynthesis monooxygenase family protein n=1 Tax=Mycolicibacterium sp. TaxID=2320850 RepID=UPI0037C960D4